MAIGLKNGMRVRNPYGEERTVVWRDGGWTALDDKGYDATGFTLAVDREAFIREGLEDGWYKVVEGTERGCANCQNPRPGGIIRIESNGACSDCGRLVTAPREQPVNNGTPAVWLNSLSSEKRKEVAVARGLFAYFPDALALIARHSVRSNEKHNPGQPVHWSREKSSDHEDCIARHSVSVAVDPDSMDDDAPHILCRAWRALAALQLWIEEKQAKGEKI